MSWIFSQSQVAANAQNAQHLQEQWAVLKGLQSAYNASNEAIATHFPTVNSGRVPADVWRDMDAQTSALMRQPNLTLLSDLLPLAKSLSIGKLYSEYRISSDAGNVRSSVSGEVQILNDKTAYTYDGNVIPVHTAGWSRDFREVAGMTSEGFDGLIDDNANVTRSLSNKMADYVYNGDANVVFNGKQGYGVKNHPNTLQISFSAALANINLATSTDPVAIRKAFQYIRDALRITNAVDGPITFYVSREILSNLEILMNTANASNVSALDMVRKLEAVAAVKEDASLTGNQVIALCLDSRYIRPLVGMATGTYAVPRQMFNDPHRFLVANAVGLEIRKDATGKAAVAYAS
jgi:hypothetical protein